MLKKHHDNFYTKHFENIRILKLLRKQYFWSEIVKNLKKYFDSCNNCNCAKFVKHKFYDVLQSLFLFWKFFTDLTMNFIIEFPSLNRGKSAFDAILIIINKYIKMIKYIPAKMNWKIENLTNVFHQKVFSNYEMFDNIVTNKNTLFISHFWSVFCYHFSIKHHYNTAFHSQTDDQTKR